MPFANLLPRRFSLQSILANAPSAPGVYGISNARQWLLIGTTEDIQSSLLNHLSEQDGAMQALAPSGFCFELCHTAMQAARQDRLVMEYEPVQNRLAG